MGFSLHLQPPALFLFFASEFEIEEYRSAIGKKLCLHAGKSMAKCKVRVMNKFILAGKAASEADSLEGAVLWCAVLLEILTSALMMAAVCLLPLFGKNN